MLRCKFEVESITRAQNTRILKMRAKSRTECDNTDWSQWTPCGTLELHVTNQRAWPQIDAMSPGDIYVVDIKPSV